MGICDSFYRYCAWHLPRRLVYWCAIRLISQATVGEYSSTVVPDLTAIEALRRWEICNGKPVAYKKPRKQQGCNLHPSAMPARVYVRTEEILSERDRSILIRSGVFYKGVETPK